MDGWIVRFLYSKPHREILGKGRTIDPTRTPHVGTRLAPSPLFSCSFVCLITIDGKHYHLLLIDRLAHRATHRSSYCASVSRGITEFACWRRKAGADMERPLAVTDQPTRSISCVLVLRMAQLSCIYTFTYHRVLGLNNTVIPVFFFFPEVAAASPYN